MALIEDDPGIKESPESQMTIIGHTSIIAGFNMTVIHCKARKWCLS